MHKRTVFPSYAAHRFVIPGFAPGGAEGLTVPVRKDYCANAGCLLVIMDACRENAG